MVPVTCPKVPLASYGVSSGDITARRGCTTRGPVSPAEVASECTSYKWRLCWCLADRTQGYSHSEYGNCTNWTKDKAKITFCIPFGLSDFNKMPSGLCNTPHTLQRLMECLFENCRYKTLLLYLDDMIVFSSSTQQHLEKLEEVFSQLQKQALKVKFTKCHFFLRQVKYLGHVLMQVQETQTR